MNTKMTQDQALQLMELLGVPRQIDASVELFLAHLRSTYGNVRFPRGMSYSEEESYLRGLLASSAQIANIVPLYQEQFSAETAGVVIQFYSSPEGKEATRKIGNLLVQTGAYHQAASEALLADFKSRLGAAFKGGATHR